MMWICRSARQRTIIQVFDMEKDKITNSELQAADLKDLQPPTFWNASDSESTEFDAEKEAQNWAQSLPDR